MSAKSPSREYILEEIRRTAEANDGKALGLRQFFKETGIKSSDWEGKFWARWGDSVLEAGFAPNQLTVAYPEQELLERYIALVRDLKRLPVDSEMRLCRRSDAAFPNHRTFRTRFGSKSGLVKKIVEYCSEKGYEDVLRICKGYVPSKASISEKSGDLQEEGFGTVYLIKSGRFYKIGKTNALGRREYEIGLQLPEKHTLVHSIKTDDPTGIEKYWHDRFASKRKNGEWFDLSPADVAAFKRRSKFM